MPSVLIISVAVFEFYSDVSGGFPLPEVQGIVVQQDVDPAPVDDKVALLRPVWNKNKATKPPSSQ